MITFYIYNPDDEEGNDDFPPRSAITISDFLENTPEWKPRLDKMIVLLSKISMSSNEDFNNFGILDHILPQLKELKERLLDRKFALLRTCIYSEPLFFIFEPKENKIYFSSLGILPQPYSGYYPLIDSPNYFKDINQQKELYNFVELNNKNNWKETLNGNLPNIQNIEYNTSELISSIDEQVILGNKLLEFLRT
ncbi:hypothetical protein [Flavobacterium hydrophilum]|uniref:Uncharacterized protein n=1 Tax=Flavobacterium hydrophilum TaxID=2211445 RepID=A0A2V4C6Q3_9FLAO|nr:hypothetical protein [Flavobacterium hydrophilum]PXY46372.1 hypothetical protein DMB68_04110 [Flavobacterium hydrophilum]